AGERVLGFEAQNYCFNHTKRNLKETITENQARNVIEGDFKIESVELALIALDNDKEVLTYELRCEGLDGLYYFYVNANDSAVEEILKVVDQQGSSLLI
ncbi:MAG: germination protein YpeB, partial [Clostridia bacterium]|nr:germination protein YpeB [Clostridia bacterium]